MHYTMYPAILRVEQVRERREGRDRQTDRQTDREYKSENLGGESLNFKSSASSPKLNQQIFDSELNQGVALPEPG
jgi:hypothetical protein